MTNKIQSARPVLLAMGAVGFLAACTMDRIAETPAYVSGYADGCQSARYEAGQPTLYARDAARISADREYAAAWLRGYQLCFFDAMRQRPLR